jgi:hypothetical protein
MGYCEPLVCVISTTVCKDAGFYIQRKVFPLLCKKPPTLKLAPRTTQLRSHDNMHTLIMTMTQPSHAVLFYINYTVIMILKWRSINRTRPCRRM